jgi:pathogenesis-related protein 1
VRRSIIVGVLLALCATFYLGVGTGVGAAQTGVSSTDITQAVNAHNSLRQQVAKDETARLKRTITIPNVSWDAAVAATAQDWANKEAARLKANPNSSPQHRPNNVYGENTFWQWSTPSQPNVTPIPATNYWGGERSLYNYESNACSGGGIACKHYTQMVWAKTLKIGCGKAQWSVGTKNYVLWVCNYSPKGNISGQRPY